MQADGAESPRGATALAATAAAALVGPYPIDEDALRKLKRLHDAGVIDEHTFKRTKAFFLGLRETIDLADARSMIDAGIHAEVQIEQRGQHHSATEEGLFVHHGISTCDEPLEHSPCIDGRPSVQWRAFRIGMQLGGGRGTAGWVSPGEI